MANKLNPPKSMTGPKRESTNKFTVNWKLANNSKDDKVGWSMQAAYLYYNDNVKGYDYTKAGQKIGQGWKRKKNLSASTTKYTFKINRKSWYPFKKDKKLKCITVIVDAYGKSGGGASSPKARITFEKPKKPSCEFDYDDSTGLLTITCKAPTHDKYDKYDCSYKVYRKDKKTNSSRYKDGKQHFALNTNAKEMKGTSTKTEFTLTTNVEQMALVQGASITFKVVLTSRGFRGDTTTTSTFVIEPPNDIAIKKIDLSNNDVLNLKKNVLTYNNATGVVRVFYYSPNEKENANYYEKGVTDYSLQRLATTYDVNKAVEAAVLSGWEEVDTNMGSTSDNKAKKKVADAVMGEPILDVLTALGFNNNAHVYDTRVWYRIRAVRQGMVTYSMPFECKAFASPVPTAKNDYSGFMAIRNSTREPGTSIEGVVGWDNTSKDNEGVDNPQWADAIWTTVVEWSEHRFATQSNNKPNELEIDWKYSNANHIKAMNNYRDRVMTGEFGDSKIPIPWGKSAFFALYGLSPGVKYYLWTRRHMVLGEYDEYGPRTPAPSGYFPFTPIDNPTNVQVYTEDNYIYGRDLMVSWTHNAVCDQKTWNIYAVPYNTKYKEGITLVKSIPKKLIASGTGKINHYKVHAGNLNEIQPKCAYGKKKYFTVKKKLGIVVGVSTGGKEILSCSDEKGRLTGINYLDIGHIPVGTMGFLDGARYTKSYSLSCTYGKPGTKLTLEFKVTVYRNSSKTTSMKIALSKIHCDKMTYQSEFAYGIEIYNGSKLVYTTSNIFISKTKSLNGTRLSCSRKLSKKIVVDGGSSIKVKLINYGGRYMDYSASTPVLRSANEKSVVKTIKKDSIVKKMKMKSTSPTAYLFSRSTNVTGNVNVFATYDTAYYLPDGEHLQPAGECVFTREIPSTTFKTIKDGLSKKEQRYFKSLITGSKKYPYVAKVNVYSHRNMFENSTYTIQGYLRDTYDDNLVSKGINKSFVYTVGRKNQARECGKGTAIKSYRSSVHQQLLSATQSKGRGVLDRNIPKSPSVKILVDRPTNYSKTDRYDVYRITPDGGVRIASDLKFDNKAFIDRYAPYSNDTILRYAIVTVKGNGDMAWKEIRYSLKSTPGIRFDWGSLDNERALELPLDVEISDSYEKDVRIDTYMDGAVAAHFNKAVKRKASNKAKLVKCDFTTLHSDPLKFAMVKELARYAGPVFFRADNGSAYECVVEVKGIDEKYDSLTSQVSFDITEINPPSDRFSSTVNKRKKNKFTPGSVGQNPKGTSSKAEKLSTTKTAKTSLITINDYLVHVYKHKKKNKSGAMVTRTVTDRISATSKKKYNDVTVSGYQTVYTGKYEFAFPTITIDMRHAPNKELASGVVGKTKNSYSVFMRLKVYEWANGTQTLIHNKFIYYGKMDGSTYKLLTSSKTKFSVSRKKTNRVLHIQPTVYFVKDVSDDSNGRADFSASYGKATLRYILDSNPNGDSPKTIKVTLNTLEYTNFNKNKVKVIVSSKPYGSAGYSASKKYYTSKEITLTTGKSSKTVKKIASSFNLSRLESKTAAVYINLVASDGSAYASKKVTIQPFLMVADIHTSITAPKTKVVSVKKK